MPRKRSRRRARRAPGAGRGPGRRPARGGGLRRGGLVGAVGGVPAGRVRGGRGLVRRLSTAGGSLGLGRRSLRGGGGAAAVQGQPEARVDEGGVLADGLAVVRVEPLPAAREVPLGGDLRQVVARHDGVDGRSGGGGRGRSGGGGPKGLGHLCGLRGRRGRGGGMGAGGEGQRQREGGATGAGHGETAGYGTGLRTAVLTLCGHGAFLSGACEVSCRVRTGDVRPRPWNARTTSPRAARK